MNSDPDRQKNSNFVIKMDGLSSIKCFLIPVIRIMFDSRFDSYCLQYLYPVAVIIWLSASSPWSIWVSRPSTGATEEEGVQSHSFLQRTLSHRDLTKPPEEKEEARGGEFEQQGPGRGGDLSCCPHDGPYLSLSSWVILWCL